MRDPRSFVLPGVFAFLAAGFAFHVAYVWRWVDCSNEASSECSTSGLAQLVIAGVGLLPALATFALAICRRGRPWRWFLLTALVYGAWGVYVSEVFVD